MAEGGILGEGSAVLGRQTGSTDRSNAIGSSSNAAYCFGPEANGRSGMNPARQLSSLSRVELIAHKQQRLHHCSQDLLASDLLAL